jgi:hypothetical protein
MLLSYLAPSSVVSRPKGHGSAIVPCIGSWQLSPIKTSPIKTVTHQDPEPGTGVLGKETNGNPSPLQGTAQPGHKSLRHRFRNNVTGGLSPEVVGVEEFTGVAGVV